MAAFNFHQRRTRRWWYSGVALVAAALFTVFYVAGAGAVVTGSPSGFESNDGNMTLDAAASGTNTDWNCFVGSDNFQAGAPNAKCKVKTGASQVTADANGEITWVNGQKFDTPCPALETGNVPNKDDFTNVASFSDVGSSSPFDVFFYGATIRQTANGNASGDVEFNQTAGNGTTSAGCRTANDRLVAYDFLSGGTSLSFHVLTWIDSSNPTAGGNDGTGACFVKTDSMPCWGAKVITPDSTQFEGETNQTAITAANNGMSGTALVAQQFAEFGVNLSQALGLGGTCTAFPQQVWESRSSGSSFTSNPEDIEFTNVNVTNCGEVIIKKHTDPRGLNQSFSYTSTLSSSSISCTQTSATSFSLNDNGNTTGDSTGNTQDCTDVPSGSYKVTEGAEPSGYSLESLSCTTNGLGSGSQDSTIKAQANITVVPGSVVTCTYTNQALGEIKIIKHTDPRGIDQNFSYSSNITGDTSFTLNDKGNTTGDSAGNTNDTKNLAVGSYNVTETLPTGWTLESLTCTTGGSQDSTTTTKANITLTAGALVTCTYQNKAPSGAIVITKTSSKAAATSLSGAKFQVCTNAGPYDPTTNPCLAPSGVTNPIGPSDVNGKVCVDGLFWNGSGTTYYVKETDPPSGYQIDDTTVHTVTVNANASCPSTGTPATITFKDTPLTTLEVIATSEASGGSKSKISCVNSSNTTVGTSITTFVDPADWKTQHLAPDTYTCTVIIDP